MKNIILTATIILIIADSLLSQTDSILFIKKADFSYYRMQKVKYGNSDDTKMEKQKTDLEDVTKVTFLSNDSLALFVSSGVPVYSRLSEIIDVGKYKNHFSLALGTVYGVVGGAIIGGIIGSMTSGGLVFSKSEMTAWGMLFGALGGGVIGAIITIAINEINHITLDLLSIPDKDKRSKLIKFLKQK